MTELSSEDRSMIIKCLFTLSREGKQGGTSIRTIVPTHLQKATRLIIRKQFSGARILRREPFSKEEITAEVDAWLQSVKTRTCAWYECKKKTGGGFRYCDNHRAEINEMAKGI